MADLLRRGLRVVVSYDVVRLYFGNEFITSMSVNEWVTLGVSLIDPIDPRD